VNETLNVMLATYHEVELYIRTMHLGGRI